MTGKELNDKIPADLKVLFKSFLEKFNLPPTPVVATTPAPVAPTVPAQPAAPAVLQEAPLEDGTTIKYDTPTLAVGSIVTIVSPEGEMPAPAGELKLKDGTVIVVVSKDGVSTVESLTPAAAPVAPVAPAAPVMNTVDPVIPQLQTQLKEVQEKFEAVTKEKDELKKQVETNKAEFVEFVGLFSKILDIPSADPINTPANKFQKALDEKANRLTIKK